mmetsp:Transcript_35792/g.89991  ORF Transcript_35792/g.89991 Transcript_35792/m.89991 type:complete len:263 (-) Transcript_35792:2209-2997(-)
MASWTQAVTPGSASASHTCMPSTSRSLKTSWNTSASSAPPPPPVLLPWPLWSCCSTALSRLRSSAARAKSSCSTAWAFCALRPSSSATKAGSGAPPLPPPLCAWQLCRACSSRFATSASRRFTSKARSKSSFSTASCFLLLSTAASTRHTAHRRRDGDAVEPGTAVPAPAPAADATPPCSRRRFAAWLSSASKPEPSRLPGSRRRSTASASATVATPTPAAFASAKALRSVALSSSATDPAISRAATSSTLATSSASIVAAS